MKNKLMIIGITILLILTSAIASYAATESNVTLQANKTQVKVGETFTVTIKATCPDGINGIDTTYSYDTEKLELQSASIVDNTKFSDLSMDNQITVLSRVSESITSADMYVFTFKVKEGVEVNSTAKVSITETLLDSDATTNSENTIPAQEISVTVVEGTYDGSDDNGTGGDGSGDAGTGDTGAGDDGAGNVGEDDLVIGGDASGDDGAGDGATGDNGTTVVVGADKKDSTTANADIPKAGINTILVLAIVAVITIAVVMYKKNQKYQDIK